ncbi:hypothetical protein C8Q72DRAFT_643787 [Fomitopsis betulina]|nr:hypothetical protein C8Q72DRAFT_643787 [Fomitopsis betulina]
MLTLSLIINLGDPVLVRISHGDIRECAMFRVHATRNINDLSAQHLPAPRVDRSTRSTVTMQLYHRQAWDFHKLIAFEYGSVVKLHAAYVGRPCLYINDPAALNYLLLSSASIVEQSSWIGVTYCLLLGPGLMSQRGEQHRRQLKSLFGVLSS